MSYTKGGNQSSKLGIARMKKMYTCVCVFCDCETVNYQSCQIIMYMKQWKYLYKLRADDNTN